MGAYAGTLVDRESKEHTPATDVASKCRAQVQLPEGHGFGPSRKIDEPERRVSLLTVAGERFRNE